MKYELVYVWTKIFLLNPLLQLKSFTQWILIRQCGLGFVNNLNSYK